MSDTVETPTYTGQDRRSAPSGHTPFETDTASRFFHIDTRFQEGSEQMQALDAKVVSLEKKVDTNNKQTAEILEIVQLAKGFFRVLGIIGKFVKWSLAIGASIAAIWAAWKSGHVPPPPPPL
jgi:hypothetical protein